MCKLAMFVLFYIVVVGIICADDWNRVKGQLISSKKTNEGIRLYYYDTSNRLVFVRFFGGNRRQQKTISKLSDLYYYSSSRLRLSSTKKHYYKMPEFQIMVILDIVWLSLVWIFISL